MSKELFVTSTPHETKLAVVEDDQLVEVFFERENEYTLAGSIYKGKVTRVLPGMQSAFVDIGLERDAFLYVTDFLEDVEGDDDDAVSASPKTESSPSNEGREDRSEGRREGGRSNRGRGRARGGRRPEQQRSAQASDLKPLDGSEIFDTPAEPEENIEASRAESQTASDETPQASESQPQAADERAPRRWRGRRGRRRGRSHLNEAKYATSDKNEDLAVPQETSDAGHEDDNDVAEEHDHLEAQHGAAEATSHERSGTEDHESAEDESFHQPHAEAAHDGHQAPAVETHETRAEHREAPPAREVRQPQRPQRIVLPGESLAKYNPRAEAEKKAESQVDSRMKAAPRPSTEIAITSPSLSAGVLAGETIAKYRNRPEPPMAEAAPAEPQHKSEAAEPAHQPTNDEGYDVHAAHVAAEKHRHEPVAHQPEAANDSAEESARGEYNFSPGSGVIEEEEIAEEEHDLHGDAENFDDSEFEELEEEILEEEDHGPENKFIAASEGLAAALMESRDPTRSNAYAADDEEDEEDELSAAGHETEDIDEAEDGEEVEAEEEASLTLEGGYDGPDVEEPELSPEDPNYSGHAEMRGPSATAGFQQRQERSDRGSDRGRRGGNRRGGRPQRGGRPMRGGGPRRNIPRGPMPQINDLLKEGQEILVQIAKEPMAKKGARITSHIALPGRFLVFMPTVNHTGVSRKIGSEEERQRLKRILISEKGTSHGGFIVRTAATGASEEDLRADIRFLINLWNEIKQRAETSKAPALIYHDLNLVERILRDQVTTTFSQIWVDNEAEYERILRFASRFQPSLVRRVKLYSKETPLFEEFSIQDEINKALKSKVWLKSGGYIVINQTEALVAIDINTGKYVGKTTRLEDTIVKTNIDAIKEIVRQIRLRDLGGIIVIDFIDMDERKNRQRVMQALEEALRSDRSPSKVLQFNDFGLVAITRKRVKQSLERTLGTQCVYCTGTGMIKSVATVCNEIYVELRKMNKHFDGNQITLRVNPEVGKALKENGGRWLLEMEEVTKKTILVKNDPAQHQEQFDIH